METIGERIKRLRAAREMTQAQLGDAIGRDQSVISDMERGRAFKVDVLPVLCDALGVSIEYLVLGEVAAAATNDVYLLRRLTPEQRASVLAVAKAMLPADKR